MKRSGGVAGLVVLLGLAACATAGGPRTFRFTSNRKSADARSCALLVLRRSGFEVVPDTTLADTARSDTTGANAPRPDTTLADTARSDTTRANAPRPDTVRTGVILTDTATLVRRPGETSDAPARWWRAEVWVDQDSQGRAVVTSLLSSARSQAGPYGPPPEELEDVGSEITSRCMW